MVDIVQLKENGTVKYMKTHADAIDGIEGKLVKAVGNETVLGTKDFADGALSKGNAVLTQNGFKYKSFTSTDFDTLQGGSVTFERYGDIVSVQFTIQTRADRDFAKDQVIAWGIPAEFQPNTDKLFPLISSIGSGGIVKFVNGASISAQTTITKNTWYWGTITYIAKNRL
ncbi:hypothetical protein [Enterococcus faecalis]|uniref:hypothetical protein n=1 Tax=Enterococcus faecalis TaxID=1351 RepID=UPI00114DA6E8|nr:hypothetical protein [Enterococcus faecalis]QDJ06835.1 hypothetical protein FLL49_10345 [Enterococcus faecalis]